MVVGCCSSFQRYKSTEPTIIVKEQKPERWASDPENVKQLMNSVVSILDPMQQQGAICSGFFVSPDLILSARHCFDLNNEETPEGLEDARNSVRQMDLEVVLYEEFSSPDKSIHPTKVHLVYMSNKIDNKNNNDVVILRLDPFEPKSKYWLAIAEENPELGEQVYSVYLPQGQPWLFAQGVVSQYYYNFDKFPQIDFLAITIPLDYGVSGSPIVNNKGEVVGMAHTMAKTKHQGSYITPTMLQEILYGWIERKEEKE